MREYNYEHPFVEIENFKDFNNSFCLNHKIAKDHNVNFLRFKTPAGYKINDHFSDWLEIFHVLKGAAEFSVKNRRFYVSEGDFIFIDYNIAHGYSTLKDVEMECLHIRHGYLEQLIPMFDSSKIICNSADELLPQKDYSEVTNSFVKASRHFLLESELDVMGFHCYLFMLVYLLMRDFSVDEKSPERHTLKAESSIDELLEYLHKHYDEDLTLETVSKELHLSPAYISRLFRQQLKIGYKEYLVKIRLEHAIYMLVNTTANIVDIANICGFPNNKSFIESFKAAYGITPSAYRKNFVNELK